MFDTVRIRHVFKGMAFCMLILMSGCTRTVQELDETELRDPLVRRAHAKAREGDKEAALNCLSMAIKKTPRLAKAHLDIALLYDDYKKDYIRAIYHYQRYLELRPQTEKREMIEGRVHAARISFAESISDELSGINEKYQALQQENIRLKKTVRRLRMNLAKRIMASSASAHSERADTEQVLESQTKGRVKTEPLPGRTAGQRYRVQPNDTLSTIAAKVYRDPRMWKKIYDANRETMTGPEELRVGQLLIIPE